MASSASLDSKVMEIPARRVMASSLDAPSKKRRAEDFETECATSDMFFGKHAKHTQIESPMQAARPSVFPFQTGSLHDFFDVVAHPLGEGKFGLVRKCIAKANGEACAVKSLKKVNLTDDAEVAGLQQEALLMQLLSVHPGVVQLKAVFEDEEQVHLVMELCEGGELFDEVVRRGKFSEPDAAHLFQQIVSAIAFCHAAGVMHRDLKPENILLKRPGNPGERLQAKVADLGLAACLGAGETITGVTGSPYYMSPEVIQGEYGQKSDVWSLGVILYVLLSGTPPFWGNDDVAVFSSVLKGHVDFNRSAWAGVSAEAKSLVRCMLSQDPAERPTAMKVLSHPWIQYHCNRNAVGSNRAGMSAQILPPASAAVQPAQVGA